MAAFRSMSPRFPDGLVIQQWFKERNPQLLISLAAMTNGKIAASGGGAPVFRGNEMVGAYGICGGTSQQDEEMARLRPRQGRLGASVERRAEGEREGAYQRALRQSRHHRPQALEFFSAGVPAMESNTARQAGPSEWTGRIEDDALLRGHGRFGDDVKPEGALAAYFVRSPHAFATIERIDVDGCQARARRGGGADRRRSGRGALSFHLASASDSRPRRQGGGLAASAGAGG